MTDPLNHTAFLPSILAANGDDVVSGNGITITFQDARAGEEAEPEHFHVESRTPNFLGNGLDEIANRHS